MGAEYSSLADVPVLNAMPTEQQSLSMLVAVCVLGSPVCAADQVGGGLPLAPASELANRVYVNAGLGAAFMSAISIQDSLVTTAALGTSGVDFDTDPGVAGDLILGLRVNESMSVEVEVGMSSLGFGGASGTLSYRPPAAPLAAFEGTLSGGSGNFLQVPVLVNASYHLPLIRRAPATEDLGLGLALGGGFGVVNTAASISDIRVRNAVVPDLTMALNGDGWSFAAQFKAALEVQISSSVSLALTYKLMVMSDADLGTADFSTDLGVSSDFETGSMLGQALLATFEFRF